MDEAVEEFAYYMYMRCGNDDDEATNGARQRLLQFSIHN